MYITYTLYITPFTCVIFFLGFLSKRCSYSLTLVIIEPIFLFYILKSKALERKTAPLFSNEFIAGKVGYTENTLD